MSTRARQVLDGLNPLKLRALTPADASNIMSGQFAAALVARGWLAETRVGQSRFRCNVAVRAIGAAHHHVGILLDVTGTAGVLERFHTQPAILKAFGWQTHVILAKDWWHDPHSVLEHIERLLRNEIEEEIEEQVDAESDPGIVPEPEPAAPATAVTSPSAPNGMKRFEFIDGGSKKLWEIGQNGCEVTVRFGRIGANGQAQTKPFPDEARASREVQKLIGEKLKRDYKEV